jgi:hypothetical protein
MEFFIPGVLIFLLSIGIAFLIAPRITPLIAIILAIIFLFFGIREHYKMFAAEYRLSTWQDSLKMYAPAVMIIMIVLFLIYAIIAFFTGASVPVPSIPNITSPSDNSVTEAIINSVNNIANTLVNKKVDVVEETNKVINKINSNRNNLLNAIRKYTTQEDKPSNNKNKEEVSRSFLETI